ncbi:Histidine phosphatase superfamily [Phytophthora cactorum]|nr:Histidine phosphatase superfamily [Phytophthora cactorum]
MSANNYAYLKGGVAVAIEGHKKTLEALADICRKVFYTGNDPVTAIEDVTGVFLTRLVRDVSELAFQHLIERLYSTPTPIAMSIGGFPQLLVRHLREGASPNRNPESPKYLSYHGHREPMHGLGFMMDMEFNFEGLPQYNGSTPLHPASTLFFELHRKGDDHFVQLFVWSPFSPRTTCELNCP